jgi:glycosyltransferase involved in cell wall biosynthesis
VKIRRSTLQLSEDGLKLQVCHQPPPRMNLDESHGRVTVVMHTYERPDFVGRDVAEGRWKDIPLLIADDASSAKVQTRLRDIAQEAGARFTARETNGGAAEAARHGVEACGTPYFMLCGDDDYLRGFHQFAEQATAELEDEAVLFVSMPEIRFVIEGQPESKQFDRLIFDGMTGRELLRELVFGGEMRALQAGTMLRTADALPHFAGGLFRTSEDFVLLARLCTAHPDRRVRVLEKGAYMRREHDASLSHTKNMSTERAVVNLLALLVGCRLLQTLVPVEDDVVLGLLRQRAQVLSTVYRCGQSSADVIEALLEGKLPDMHTQEADEALRFLVERQDEIPIEIPELRRTLADVQPPTQEQSAAEILAAAAQALDAGETDRAQQLIEDLDDPEEELALPLLALQARIGWNQGDAATTIDRLTRALVIDPEHADSLHMLVQVAQAAGEERVAQRLENRLVAVLPTDIAAQLDVESHEGVDDLRVAFLVSKGLDQFLDEIIRDLIPRMDARKFVVTTREDILTAMEWADVCWFEWCNDPVIWASRQDVARRKALICRLHRYEAFSDMPLTVQWDHVDSLVVVAEHLGDIVAGTVPGLRQRTRITHIPNGVDMSRYSFREGNPGFSIALVGYLHGRKNPGLALQILHQLVREEPRYRLHVAGTFQDPALKLYWNHMIQALGLTDHVIKYDWQPDIAGFLADKDYLLSTSTHESFGYTIAEAMTCGIKPVVHNFPCATDMWPSDILFNTVEEAAEQIRSQEYHSEAYRDFVTQHYTLSHQVDEIEKLIRSTARSASGDERPEEVTDITSVHPQTVNAILQCRCPACRSEITIQQQTIAGHPVARQRCTSCATLLQVGPDAYRRALERYEARVIPLDSAKQTAEIRRVARTWAKDPIWERVMTVDGLNLGELMEFDISPGLVRGWLNANESEPVA